eukprot:scaffold9200_cov93-Isochrysis_galbana.AAC.1
MLWRTGWVRVRRPLEGGSGSSADAHEDRRNGRRSNGSGGRCIGGKGAEPPGEGGVGQRARPRRTVATRTPRSVKRAAGWYSPHLVWAGRAKPMARCTAATACSPVRRLAGSKRMRDGAELDSIWSKMASVADASAPGLVAAAAGGGGSTQTKCMPGTVSGDSSPCASHLASASVVGCVSGARSRANKAGQSTPATRGHSSQSSGHTAGGPAPSGSAAPRALAASCAGASGHDR